MQDMFDTEASGDMNLNDTALFALLLCIFMLAAFTTLLVYVCQKACRRNYYDIDGEAMEDDCGRIV